MKQIYFETIDSTSAYLKCHYHNLDDLTFVSAGYQTQGKGRNNRIWYSDNNNLLFSLLLKDDKYFDLTNAISIVSAYSILEVLQSYNINNVSIKWPNDVYVGNKKICGILLEGISSQSIECLIIGVGINVNQNEFDKEYIYAPTSMKAILCKDIDINELREKVYTKLITNINKLVAGYNFYQDINKYDYLKNKDVYALINNKQELVKVKGINEDYTLCVDYNDSEYNLNSGEISFHI